MKPDVHAVVQDAADFDDAGVKNSIQQEMTAGSAMPRDVQHAETRHDVVAPPGST
jgi:hypothetical protein